MIPDWVDAIDPKESATYRIYQARMAGDEALADELVRSTLQEMEDAVFEALGKFHAVDAAFVITALTCADMTLRDLVSSNAGLLADMYINKAVRLVILPLGMNE